jgi:hypothetical protein
VQADTQAPAASLHRWGALAAFVVAAGFIIAPWIYLVGNLREAFGALGYSIADFFYGPAWGAGLITLFFVLREQLRGRAPRRMSLALLAAVLAAGAMLLVACIRAANRAYHLHHPELHLENNGTVLLVWTTLVAGITAAGWHSLGWALMLLGSAGFTSRLLPRLLCALYLAGGLAALFVYVAPEMEGAANLLGLVWAVWQGILLWKNPSAESHSRAA